MTSPAPTTRPHEGARRHPLSILADTIITLRTAAEASGSHAAEQRLALS